MKRTFKQFIIHAVALAPLIGLGATTTEEVQATKDTFGRSNQRNRNNGAATQLLIADVPSVRTIVGFDLSAITNEIVGAEFQVRMQNTMPDPVALIIAPMAQTKNNAKWIEGSGALGVRGRNARMDEATLTWRAFRDQPWESASGDAVASLLESNLWKKPIATLGNLQWVEGQWIKVALDRVSMVEEIRLSESPVLTIGMWGTSGKGLYNLDSRESGHAPRLILILKEEEK